MASMPMCSGRFGPCSKQAYPLVHSRLTRELIGAHSLLFTWRGTDSTAAPFLVMAHQDVVPVEPGTEANWEHPPFSGAIADGFLWGRGSIDDKASLIGILEGIESLLAEGFTPGPTVYVFLGHDEEVGGERGAAVVAARFGERAERLAFVLDEGGAVVSGLLPGVPPLALVGIGEKASLDVEITGRGGRGTLFDASGAYGRRIAVRGGASNRGEPDEAASRCTARSSRRWRDRCAVPGQCSCAISNGRVRW